MLINTAIKLSKAKQLKNCCESDSLNTPVTFIMEYVIKQLSAIPETEVEAVDFYAAKERELDAVNSVTKYCINSLSDDLIFDNVIVSEENFAKISAKLTDNE